MWGLAHEGRILGEPSVRCYEGHGRPVLDLSWGSRRNALLCASLDRMVRLWHVDRQHCLGVFPLGDAVVFPW